MEIKTLFDSNKDIYRNIEKVITYGVSQEDRLRAEISEYVVTDSIEDQKNRELFKKLGALFALQEIREDATWYLEHGYIGSTKSKAIRQRVERLSTELRPHIENLVDGFGIPEHCLTAPIIR